MKTTESEAMFFLKPMQYSVNGISLTYEALGNRNFGENVVMIDRAIDLTRQTEWHKDGFSVEDLFDFTTYTSFREQTHELLINRWKQAGLHVDRDFPLEQYHSQIRDLNMHLEALEKTKLLSVADFPISIKHMEERISRICNAQLIAKNPYDGQSVFHFRVIRPNRGDNNPLHRDVWLEDYDNCINLYIPVAGSDERSSLVLLPGSHRWPESRIERTESGATINGLKFNVPAVTAIEGLYETARPDPKENQVLVFSPYLIHGGSANLNNDTTRISIELRLWKK